jgi:enoyl-CoA hydratase/carnithine racemase
MGACAILPRIIGQGRASELLYTGRFMSAEEEWAMAASTPIAHSMCSIRLVRPLA